MVVSFKDGEMEYRNPVRFMAVLHLCSTKSECRDNSSKRAGNKIETATVSSVNIFLKINLCS